MSQRLSRFGVGPKILTTAATYAVVAGAMTSQWPDRCCITAVPRWILLTAGMGLIALGVPMLVLAVRKGMAAYDSNELATTGLFAVVRNPMYAAWIVFIIPGVVLLTRSWPLLLTPLAAYLAFKLLIRQESECLEERFGDAYRQYRAETNELFPRPRWRRRQP